MVRFAVVAVLACGCASEPAHVTLETTVQRAAPAPIAQAPKIPNTDIDDTADNREVIAVCERYRAAMEARDANAIIALASRRYHEGDVTYDTLAAFVRKTFGSAIAIRYEIRYDMISRTIDEVIVDIHFSASFQLADGKWQHTTDTSRLVLTREEGRWRILSGM